MMILQQRKLQLVNTDPQRRCYNGCNYSEAWVWSAWEDIHSTTEEKAESDLAWWRDLDSSKAGKREFRVKETVNANIPTLS